MLIQAEDIIQQSNPVVLIEGDLEAEAHYGIADPKCGYVAHLEIRARRLGSDPVEDILYEWGSILTYITERHREGIGSALPPSEEAGFHSWHEENPP